MTVDPSMIGSEAKRIEHYARSNVSDKIAHFASVTGLGREKGKNNSGK